MKERRARRSADATHAPPGRGVDDGALRTLRLFDRLPRNRRPLAAAAVGAVAGIRATSGPRRWQEQIQAVAFPLGLSVTGLVESRDPALPALLAEGSSG